ncbi:MAG: hypothetical protein H6704_13080 [Myxococcales bacterium]|nr:hypothetical protein [Myxococcales bacterium]
MTAPRMLIGTLDIGNNIRLLATGFRAIGFDVTTATVAPNGVFYAQDYDLNLADLHAAALESIKHDNYPDWVCDDPRWAALFDYDIYLFVASHTLLPGLLDLPLLKQRGKIVISFQAGSEVRFWQMARTFNAAYGHSFPEGLISRHVNGARDLGAFAGYSRYLDVFANKLHNIRMAERYADLLLSQPCSNVLGVRPYMAAILPVDTQRCTARVPGRERPVVVHAPTNPEFKQSGLIFATLDRLWREGVGFELRLLRNVPNHQVLDALTDCDVLIDQIACGKTGLLGFEGMASGCMVIGCNDEEAAPVPYRSLPVARIAPDNVYDVLKTALTDRVLRVRAAEAGLRYLSLGHHTPQRVAQYILDCLDRSQRGDFDYYPTQLIEQPEFPSEEVVPQHLVQLTWDVLTDFGVAPDADLEPMKARGLVPGDAPSAALPRWDLTNTERLFWGWRGPNAVYPRPRGKGG